MTRSVVLLGSTGSIGTQALDVVARHRERFDVVGLAAGGGQVDLVVRQALAFGPATGGVWVTDRGSTNGTVVVSPDGGAAVLAAGTRAEVGTGWTVRFGSRSFRVEGL